MAEKTIPALGGEIDTTPFTVVPIDWDAWKWTQEFTIVGPYSLWTPKRVLGQCCSDPSDHQCGEYMDDEDQDVHWDDRD